MRRTKELPRKIRNLSGYRLVSLALAGITMYKGAFEVKTKLLSWLLTLSLLMTMLPTAALAAAAPGTSSGTVIYVSESGDDSAAGDENAPLKTIGAAFTKAADGGTIYLLSDIVLPSKTVLSGDKSITLAGKAGETAKKITCQKASSSDDYMIEVGVEYGTATATNLTLENVTIDAEGQDIRCIRVCPKSQLTLENGATVCNGRAVHRRDDHSGNTGTNDWGGGIVVDSNAKLIMNDGSAVTGCSAEQGGGIYLSGEMELNGGTISGNTAVGDYYRPGITQSAHGGAILIRANRADYDESYDVPAKLTMTGGNIQNNKAASDRSAFGGAVAILGTYKNTVDLTNEFIMTGGTISGNTAGYGGAISAYAADSYWNGNASVKVSGNAEITQNIGRNGGGAIALWTSKADNYTSTVEMSGGTISGNETFSNGGGVFLYGKGDSFYMTDGKISDNEAKQGGGISISDTDAAAYLLGGTIQDNKAIDGYPHVDDASERSYYGNAVYQDGSLYLDGTKANISGDIRIGCRFDTSGGISTNRFVALVGASDTMNNYELTSFENESLDGRVVVVPDTITYGTETYSVADAEPYLAHFTHNHKEIITDTDYTAETGASSQAKSLVLYGAIQKYSVTYTDGIGGASFADEVTSDLRRGTPTPAFTGGTPTHSGYTFTGWSPAVAATVTANAVYTAQWVPIGGGGEDPYGNLTVSKTVTGKAGDTEQKFTFTVKLDRAISGANGDMTFNNGTAVVTLKHGESSTATKLPADIHYTVTESDNDGYTVTANGATGVISDGKTAVAAFINTKDSDAPDQPSNPDSPVTPNQPGSPDVPNDSGTPDDVPKMGDTMNLGLWISLMELSLAGLFISLVVVKKRTRRNRHSN